MTENTAAKQTTSYAVLVQVSDTDAQLAGETWKVVNPGMHAFSAEQAIRLAVDEHPEAFGDTRAVAVPSRSWQPRTVRIQTETVTKLDLA